MSRNMYLNLVEKELQKQMGEEYRLQIHDIWKFNDMVYTGMVICKEGYHVSPVYDFGKYAVDIENGKDTGLIVEEILEDYENSQRDFFENSVLLENYSSIKERIRIMACKKEWNRNYVKGKVQTDFLDFVVLYYLDVHDWFPEEKEWAKIMITEEYLGQWEVTVEDIHRDALENLNREGWFQVIPLDGLLQKLSGKEVMEEIYTENAMYILADWTGRNYGAAALFISDLLEKAAEKLGGSYYILPSSVSELILVPAGIQISLYELISLVNMVNQTEVERRSQLSNQVYYYDAEKHQVRIAG